MGAEVEAARAVLGTVIAAYGGSLEDARTVAGDMTGQDAGVGGMEVIRSAMVHLRQAPDVRSFTQLGEQLAAMTRSASSDRQLVAMGPQAFEDAATLFVAVGEAAESRGTMQPVALLGGDGRRAGLAIQLAVIICCGAVAIAEDVDGPRGGAVWLAHQLAARD